MTPDGIAPRGKGMLFEIWKVHLRKDCELQGKLRAFDSLGEYTLKLLWEDGLDPRVDAIVESSRKRRRAIGQVDY